MSQPRSWNRIPDLVPEKVQPVTTHHLPKDVPTPLLAHGNGRSYGDVCLNDRGTTLLTRTLDNFIQFDRATGILRCESGVTLQEILQLVVPYGWFLASTPGTRYATVGGAIANDVHGKNHHFSGSFGHHVLAFELLRSSGERLLCSPSENTDYFKATIGGMGLTGLISWAEIQLLPVRNPWMWTESHRFQNLDEFWDMNAQAEIEWPYTVSWIDCLSQGEQRGRGLLLTGRHAASQNHEPVYKEKQRNVPVTPPISAINKLSLRCFNTLYYNKPVSPEGQLTHYTPYFYPLDAINNWNRIYGPKGFYQYQCVLPPEAAQEGTADLLTAIAASGQGSFLAVLKTFGDLPSVGMMSFPRPGPTLALDFPNRGADTLKLFRELDSIVSHAGGALYPAKDARMPPELFRSGYPQWEAFSQYIDPQFSSHFWRRVTS